MDLIIDTYMTEYWEAIKKLEQIPGIGKKSAEIILAEIGLDMNQLPSAGHLASWAGVAPGINLRKLDIKELGITHLLLQKDLVSGGRLIEDGLNF